MDAKKIRWIAFILILFLISSLGGWYWYLSVKQGSLGELSTGRGFGSSIPTFVGDTGSTFEHIIQGLGFQSETQNPAEKPPRLWRILATPGAGHGFVAGATSTHVRFLERSTGYVFETNVLTGVTERLTNTLIPQVYEAQFSGDGSPIIERLKDGSVIAASLEFEASTTSEFTRIIETYLGNTLQIVAHPKTRDILALVPDGNGSTLIRSGWDGTKPSRVYSSTLTGWRIHWLSDDSIVMAQKPASGVPGTAFRVDGGTVTPLARGIPGLTILPKAHSGALLVGSDSNFVSLGVKGSTASSTVTVPLRTTPEKCVWSPGTRPIAYCAVPTSINSQQYINDWYQGRIHTRDTWWKVDAGSGAVEPLYTPSDNEEIDVEMPVINDIGEYIAFRNAYDKSVWVLRIAE